MTDLHRITLFTHDSMVLGRDGPAHRPVERPMVLRGIPNDTVLRRVDANTTAASWRLQVGPDGRVDLTVIRSDLPRIRSVAGPVARVERGAYGSEDPGRSADVPLRTTVPEVHLVRNGAAAQCDDAIAARVVSMPSTKRCEDQTVRYSGEVLSPAVPTVTIEASISRGWHALAGNDGALTGLDHFGFSGLRPGGVPRTRVYGCDCGRCSRRGACTRFWVQGARIIS